MNKRLKEVILYFYSTMESKLTPPEVLIKSIRLNEN